MSLFDEYKTLIISIIGSIFVGILFFLNVNILLIIIVVLILIISILTILIVYPKEKKSSTTSIITPNGDCESSSNKTDPPLSISIGLEEVIPEKGGELKKDPTFLNDAKDCIRILGSSLRTIWADNKSFRAKLAEVGKNTKIQILLLNPESKYVKERADMEGIAEETYKGQIVLSINAFKKFKEKEKIPNMELYLYDEFPVWNMIIIDHNFAKISYFPIGKDGSKAPYYVFNGQGEYNPIEPFMIYFNKLAQRSKKEI
ncbi:MAG: hypothetical protein WA102_13675 [Candidatus Methanoperedens sp.]